MADLSLSEKMAIKHLKELEEFGLVEKKRRGFGLPSILYVKSFIVPDEAEKEQEKINENDSNQEKSEQKNTSQAHKTSRTVEMGSSRTADLERTRTAQKEGQELPTGCALKNKADMSNNYISNTKINKTKSNNNQSNHILKNGDGIGLEYDKKTQIRGYEKVIKMKINYDTLVDRYPHEKERIDGMIEIMVETLISDSDYINIGGTEYPKELVKSKLLKLDSTHIEYVMMCMDNNTTKIYNIRKYLLSALFNAPSTIDSYYRSLVNHDMYGCHS